MQQIYRRAPVPKCDFKTLVPGPLFYKVVGLSPATILNMRLWHSCFPAIFAKFVKHFFTEHFWWLILIFAEDHTNPEG